MLNPNPYMILSGALGFSAADLNANRLGVLTPRQREMLSSQRLHALGLPAMVMLMLLAGGYVLHMQLLFIVFCGACLVSTLLATWQRFQEDLEGRVEMIAGKWALRALPLGRYAAVMNGQSFSLTKQVKNAFSESGHYRLYYTPGTRTILSAEII